ncbi:MAG: D-Ala-D-Ala carboxypeptidase family metallohydrolase [Candidatus Gastranaerophilales bacterium]|nr:D-Ala-D-Ala carboxypeptidase family metallohydrolase [Candidatus Gastranaerophilales bacterium]
MIQTKIENFLENEIKCKCCGVLNISDKAIISLQAFRYMLNNKYKRNIRLTVNSGCRCRKHNKAEGGVDEIRNGILVTSRHECTTKKSDAFDLISPDLDYKTLYQEAVDSKMFNTIIRYDIKHFVHVDTEPRPNFEIKAWSWNK